MMPSPTSLPVVAAVSAVSGVAVLQFAPVVGNVLLSVPACRPAVLQVWVATRRAAQRRPETQRSVEM